MGSPCKKQQDSMRGGTGINEQSKSAAQRDRSRICIEKSDLLCFLLSLLLFNRHYAFFKTAAHTRLSFPFYCGKKVKRPRYPI